MEELLQLVEQERIFLDYDNININGKLFGLYFYDPERQRPYIVLDHHVKQDNYLHRSILAEELGHHFTIPQTNFLVPYTSYSQSLRLGVDERRALEWACNKLIPMKLFRRAVMSGLTQVFELAEYFQVTQWLVYRRIQFAKRKCRREDCALCSITI